MNDIFFALLGFVCLIALGTYAVIHWFSIVLVGFALVLNNPLWVVMAIGAIWLVKRK